jgi:hypothetical protein
MENSMGQRKLMVGTSFDETRSIRMRAKRATIASQKARRIERLARILRETKGVSLGMTNPFDDKSISLYFAL